MAVDPKERDEARAEFERSVNMTGGELSRWLDTEESKSVGWKDDGGESVGHEMGRHILELKGKRRDDLDEEDVKRMRKVTGYVHRHLAQRPDHPPEELARMPWTYSLRNWGHDPLK
jgi:hypothetical protein